MAIRILSTKKSVKKSVAKSVKKHEFNPEEANRINESKAEGKMLLEIILFKGNKRDPKTGELLTMKGILRNPEDGRRLTGYVGFGIDRPFVKENGTKAMDKGSYTFADLCGLTDSKDDDDDDDQEDVVTRGDKASEAYIAEMRRLAKADYKKMMSGAGKKGIRKLIFGK